MTLQSYADDRFVTLSDGVTYDLKQTPKVTGKQPTYFVSMFGVDTGGHTFGTKTEAREFVREGLLLFYRAILAPADGNISEAALDAAERVFEIALNFE